MTGIRVCITISSALHKLIYIFKLPRMSALCEYKSGSSVIELLGLGYTTEGEYTRIHSHIYTKRGGVTHTNIHA